MLLPATSQHAASRVAGHGEWERDEGIHKADECSCDRSDNPGVSVDSFGEVIYRRDQ